MKLHYSLSARDDAKRLSRFIQQRVFAKLRHYARQPDPLTFAEPLSGSNEYRFRIGDYRVIFEVINDTIWVLAIKRRDEAYR